jgi:hypothetical protein
MHAATQHILGTMQTAPVRLRMSEPLSALRSGTTFVMTPAQPPRQYCIRGVTHDGRSFRPSDWAERLAGAMSSFRPGGGRGGIGSFIGYSPYCVPQVVDGVKAVLVNEALKDIEPMAWDFVMNFARDNQLQVSEVGALPTGNKPV